MKTDNIFLAYRCKSCLRIVTKLQVLALMSGTSGHLCVCGGNQIAPCDIVGLDWLQPRVWKLAYAYLRGQLAPPPEASRPVHVEPMKPVGGAGA